MKKKIIYELLTCALAIFAVILAFIDISKGLNTWQLYADMIILIVFILDYIVRFFVSKNKKSFIKENILDLISIIPFSSFFRILRVFKLTKLLKILKISKLVKFTRFVTYIARLVKKGQKFLNTNGFKYMLTLTASSIFIGSVGISYFEKMDFVDGLWWSFVTTTTVGYGDLSPVTTPGRIIAVILMIIGIGLLSSTTSTITSYFFTMSDKNKSVKKETLNIIISDLERFDDLSDEDIDCICILLKSLRK